MSMSSMPIRFMALHRDGKNYNNRPYFLDFFKLKMTIRISYKCKHVKVLNLLFLEVQVLFYLKQTALYLHMIRFCQYSLFGR